ncbi:ParA family protein [Microbacterium testaceum]|uniref:ParA family protein n=1 Tax=Microbacterium testaceum TaxID=2033 RepID=UPI002AC563BF|nr:ParA family protein [Microbacterium testaceum]MDZ5146367.1 ParA family protein [Microbacterium testaceum]
MRVLGSYNEAGGQGKTTSAVSIAMCAAEAGHRTVLIDLDPRGAATEWIDVEPKSAGLHIGSILANDGVEGWAEELAVPTRWHKNLRVIPSDRSVSNREKDSTPGLELRLRESLADLDADVVILDCPNRQGGPLTLSAFHAADAIIYAASPTSDGVSGVRGAQRSVAEFQRLMERMNSTTTLREAGIVLGNLSETVISRVAKNAIDELRETGLLLTPIVPARTIVQESRTSGEWYGHFRKGEPVLSAYQEITRKVLQ